MHKKFTKRGFTLIELLITILVLAIVMAIAIPSFYSIIQNNLTVATSNDLMISLNYARSEAIKRGANVSLCPAADQTFSGCGNDWNQGWLIFVNPNANTNYSASNSAQVLLRTQSFSGATPNITTSPSTSLANYNSAGFAGTNTSNLTFNISATGCQGPYARSLNISMTGRVTVTKSNCP
ncbi:GspH/FimT family pseudopilin [Candidatus Berkiella aquae]|uniref:Type II secretion system protein H n=1 Tax=Candidatus Berkiella aquae TaxID=295108 RepID=A0A0Q9Z1F1_9GAMM|nr:GspH/FimT family pseudopilin [Candidatus Berkiella aquae]MCS5712492.1 GspH/FimT family pseudopilin [Candidatus Berkiella aquae]